MLHAVSTPGTQEPHTANAQPHRSSQPLAHCSSTLPAWDSNSISTPQPSGTLLQKRQSLGRRGYVVGSYTFCRSAIACFSFFAWS